MTLKYFIVMDFSKGQMDVKCDAGRTKLRVG
jgi:hypothetical protein